MDIKNDLTFKRFIQNREIKPNTQKRYYENIKNYCEFIGKTPTELINEADMEEDNSIKMRNRKIKEYLLSFKDNLIERDYSPRSIASIISVVKMFYSESDIILPVIRFKKNIRKETFEDLPTKEEIRKVMTFANIKYQSVILLMLSSGMRASDIRALKYHDFLISLKDYIKLPKSGYLPIDVVVDLLEENRKDLIVPVWKLTAIKTSTPFITFSTPESLKLLINYLKIYNPTDPRQYLFPSKRYPDQPIGSRAFAYYFKWLNELADLGKPDRQIKFRSHALRKYFASTLSQAGVQQLTIDRLLAHSVGDLAEAYIKPTAKGLMDQYLPCIKALSIEDTEVHILESPEYKELKSLRKELNEMKALMDKEREDKMNSLPLPK